MMLDSQLRFTSHIDHVVGKAARMLGFIKRNTKGLGPETKILLFNSLVRSHLEFASVVWSPQYIVHSQRVESIQRSFTRHLAFFSSGISHRATYDLRLKYFKLVTLRNRRLIIDLLFLYKIVNALVDCGDILAEIKFSVPRCYPRQYISRLLFTPLPRTNLLMHSPLFRICSDYNRVSAEIQALDIFGDSLARFKQKLYKYII